MTTEGLGAIFLEVRLRHGTEMPNPVFLFVKTVRVVDDVAHLVPQVTQQIDAPGAFDKADTHLVHRAQIRATQIERDADRNRFERNTPFVGQVEIRLYAPNSGAFQLFSELVEHGHDRRSVDRQAKIANRSAEQLPFLKMRLHGIVVVRTEVNIIGEPNRVSLPGPANAAVSYGGRRNAPTGHPAADH